MGMYTAMVFVARVKPDMISCLPDNSSLDTRLGSWSRFKERHPDIDLPARINVGYIPFSADSYNECDIANLLRRLGNKSRGATDDEWVVACDIKNYEGEIQFFMERILPLFLAEPCLVYSRYEEDPVDEWEVYTVKPKE